MIAVAGNLSGATPRPTGETPREQAETGLTGGSAEVQELGVPSPPPYPPAKKPPYRESALETKTQQTGTEKQVIVALVSFTTSDHNGAIIVDVKRGLSAGVPIICTTKLFSQLVTGLEKDSESQFNLLGSPTKAIIMIYKQKGNDFVVILPTQQVPGVDPVKELNKYGFDHSVLEFVAPDKVKRTFSSSGSQTSADTAQQTQLVTSFSKLFKRLDVDGGTVNSWAFVITGHGGLAKEEDAGKAEIADLDINVFVELLKVLEGLSTQYIGVETCLLGGSNAVTLQNKLGELLASRFSLQQRGLLREKLKVCKDNLMELTTRKQAIKEKRDDIEVQLRTGNSNNPIFEITLKGDALLKKRSSLAKNIATIDKEIDKLKSEKDWLEREVALMGSSAEDVSLAAQELLNCESLLRNLQDIKKFMEGKKLPPTPELDTRIREYEAQREQLKRKIAQIGQPARALSFKISFPLTIHATTDATVSGEIHLTEFSEALKEFLKKTPPPWYNGKQLRKLFGALAGADPDPSKLPSVLLPGTNTFFRTPELEHMRVLTWQFVQKAKLAQAMGMMDYEDVKPFVLSDVKFILAYPCDMRTIEIDASTCDDVALISKIPAQAQHYIGGLKIKQGPENVLAHWLTETTDGGYARGKFAKAWFMKKLTAPSPTDTLERAVFYTRASTSEKREPAVFLVGKRASGTGEGEYVIRKGDKPDAMSAPQKLSDVVTEVTGRADINPGNVYYWLARAIFEGTRASLPALHEATGGNEDQQTEQEAFNDFVARVAENASQDAHSFTQAMVLLFENGYPELVAKTVVVAKTITQDKAAVLGPKIVSLCKDIINWEPLVTLVEVTPQQPSKAKTAAHLEALTGFITEAAELFSSEKTSAPKNVEMPEFVALILSNKICHLAEGLLTRQITSKNQAVPVKGTIWPEALDPLINALSAKKEYEKVLEKILKSLNKMGTKHGVIIVPPE